MNNPIVPSIDQEKTIDEVVAPFDLQRVQDITAQAGLTLQFSSTPDVGDPDCGLWQIEVSGRKAPCLVSAEWSSRSAGIWGVYVDADLSGGDLTVAESVEFAADVDRAGRLAARLNETDADRAQRMEAKEKHLVPCTEVHCEFFGIGHEEFVSSSEESVIHTRPTNSDTNWGVVVNKPSSQTEWTVDLDANPYEMPVSEIDELVAQLLLARADLVSINAA